MSASTLTTKPPTVSVVIPTYNRATLLRRAIESVQAQSLTDWEILVADDGSTDDTRAMVNALVARDKRIIYLPQPHAGYPAPGLNHGLRHARGRFLLKLDDDDMIDSNYLARCTQSLRDHVDRDMVATAVRHKNAYGEHISYNEYPYFFRTAILRDVGGWNEFFRAAEDGDLLLRLFEQGGKIYRLDDTFYTYTIHDAQTTSKRPIVFFSYFIYSRTMFWRGWGLPDPTRWGWSYRRIAHLLQGRKQQLPYIAHKYLTNMAYLHWVGYDMAFKNFWVAWENRLRALVAMRPRFPYAPVWRMLWGFLHELRLAHYPIIWSGGALYSAAQHYWRSARKRSGQSVIELTHDVPAQNPARVTILLIADSSLPMLRATLSAIETQTLSDWGLIIGLPHKAPQTIRDFVDQWTKQSQRACFLAFTCHLPYWTMRDVLRQQVQGGYIFLHDQDAQLNADALEKCMAHITSRANVVWLSTNDEIWETPIFFRNLPQLRFVAIADTKDCFPSVEEEYCKGYMQFHDWQGAHMQDKIYRYKKLSTLPNLRHTPQARRFEMAVQIMQDFMTRGLPDLFRQGYSLGVVSGVEKWRMQLLPWRWSILIKV